MLNDLPLTVCTQFDVSPFGASGLYTIVIEPSLLDLGTTHK
jgi:hypothetical protein